MHGGVTHPSDGYPARCEAYLVSTSQRRASAGYPSSGWVSADGPFSAACHTAATARSPIAQFTSRTGMKTATSRIVEAAAAAPKLLLLTCR